jgi:hypothetical protein
MIVAPDSTPAGVMKFGRQPDRPLMRVTGAGDRLRVSADFPAGAIEFAFVGQGDALRGAWRADWGEGAVAASRTKRVP